MSEASTPPVDTRQIERADVWSRYWATGAAHSCGGSFGPQYEGALGAWWRAVFEGLTAQSRLLDLATGSGAVLQLALRHAGPRAIQMDGVDLGQISPTWTQALPPGLRARIRFHPGVQIERLPFGDRSFELVTSQFGIEYTDLNQSLAEVRRVLCAGGSFRCVLHHADSQPVQLAQAEAEHMQWLLAPDGLLQTAGQLCEPFAQASTPQGRTALAKNSSANALRQRFNLLQDEWIKIARASICPDVLHEASDVIKAMLGDAAQKGVVPALSRSQAYAQQLRDSAFRLSELIDCAQSHNAMDGLTQRLKVMGFESSFGALRDEGRLMGHWLKADLSA